MEYDLSSPGCLENRQGLISGPSLSAICFDLQSGLKLENNVQL